MTSVPSGASARHTAHAQRQIQPQTAGGDGIHLHGGVVAQLHDGALAELLFDLRQRRGQRVLLGCTNADFPVRVDRKCKVSVDEPANCLAMESPD